MVKKAKTSGRASLTKRKTVFFVPLSLSLFPVKKIIIFFFHPLATDIQRGKALASYSLAQYCKLLN